MVTWFRQIDRATSVPQVMSVVRDYLATWTPEELARLPENCRPGRIRDEADLEQSHALLVEEYRRSHLEGDELAVLQQLTSFMVRASVRLSQLRADEDIADKPPLAGAAHPSAAREH